MSRLVAVLAIALALGGCATLGGPQQAEYQRLADQVTAHYHAGKVWVLTHRGLGSLYHCGNSTIDLSLIGDNPRWSLAHELGHHMHNDCGGSLAKELAANAFAVEAMQVWGYTEAQAVEATLTHLTYTAHWWATHPNTPKPGAYKDHDFCYEAREIVKRHPAFEGASC